MIALNLANNTYKPVYVPDEEDICVKEYIRMMKDFKTSLKKIKTTGQKHFYYAMDWFMTKSIDACPSEVVKGFEANRFIERNAGRIPITV